MKGIAVEMSCTNQTLFPRERNGREFHIHYQQFSTGKKNFNNMKEKVQKDPPRTSHSLKGETRLEVLVLRRASTAS